PRRRPFSFGRLPRIFPSLLLRLRGMPNISVPMSVLRAVPRGDDAVLMAQCNVTIRVFAGCSIVRRITNAGIGRHCDDLLNRGASLVPNFDFVRQIFPIDRNWPGRSAASRSPGGLRRRSPSSIDLSGRLLLTVTRIARSHHQSQSAGTVNCWDCWVKEVGTGRFTIAITASTIKQSTHGLM